MFIQLWYDANFLFSPCLLTAMKHGSKLVTISVGCFFLGLSWFYVRSEFIAILSFDPMLSTMPLSV
uniref:Uncharacterized protein n=1 Tax=Arundo donax TaxID=35708 RepID=A0A0A8ZKP8_ARUDO